MKSWFFLVWQRAIKVRLNCYFIRLNWNHGMESGIIWHIVDHQQCGNEGLPRCTFFTTTSGIYQRYINPFFLASLPAWAPSELMWTLTDSKTDANHFSRALEFIVQVFWHEIICQSCHCCSTLFQRPVYQSISSCRGIDVGLSDTLTVYQMLSIHEVP